MIEKVNAPLTQVYKLMLQTRAALPFLLYFYFFFIKTGERQSSY